MIDDLLPVVRIVDLVSDFGLPCAGIGDMTSLDLPREATFQITIDSETPLHDSDQIAYSSLSTLDNEHHTQPSTDYSDMPGKQAVHHVTIPSTEAPDGV